MGGPKPRKIKSKYDLELAANESIDPNNWEINSANRQRALYGKLYAEMDKQGVVKDPNAIFEHKLNNLAEGDFRGFVAKIWAERSISGSESSRRRQSNSVASKTGEHVVGQGFNTIQEVSQETIDNISYRVTIRMASSLEADSTIVNIEQ